MSDEPATVFIIDNDNSLRESLQWLLESAGIVSAGFASGEAFLAAVDRTRAGCVMLDVRLPGMSGVMLQEAMQRAGLRLPMIVMTGYADVGTAVRMLKAGAFDFFEKPFTEQVLLERIEQAIAVDASRRAARARRDALASRLACLRQPRSPGHDRRDTNEERGPLGLAHLPRRTYSRWSLTHY